jgi:hypothetical protein
VKNFTLRTSRATNPHLITGCAPGPSATPPARFAKPTRRQFLVNCSALVATASIAPTALARPFRGRSVPLEQIGPGEFARQLNTIFLVHLERGAPVKLILDEVRPLVVPNEASPYAEDAQNEKFALMFRGLPVASLAQDTYTFEHHRIGSFEMFIVPIGCLDQSHCYYEAIFNRPGPRDRLRNFGTQSS